MLTWVSQEQGDVQLIGYIEGAPPCPMANLTNKPATTFLEPTTIYAGATSVTLTAPTSVTLKYQQRRRLHPTRRKWSIRRRCRRRIRPGRSTSPRSGSGSVRQESRVSPDSAVLGAKRSWPTRTTNGNGLATHRDRQARRVEQVHGEAAGDAGALHRGPVHGEPEHADHPEQHARQSRVRRRRSFPIPNLGGFTTSNPPSPLPKTADGGEVWPAHVRAVALRPGLRDLANAGRLPADAAADQHGVWVRPHAQHPDSRAI